MNRIRLNEADRSEEPPTPDSDTLYAHRGGRCRRMPRSNRKARAAASAWRRGPWPGRRAAMPDESQIRFAGPRHCRAGDAHFALALSESPAYISVRCRCPAR